MPTDILSISSSMNTGFDGAGGLQRLHEPAGHRADVGAPVPADLGFVAHAAQRDAHELAVHRARDRLPERRLADARRADEAEDRSLQVPLQLPDGEVFDDPFFDLVEVVVVLVEHTPCLDRIEPIVGRLRPRHVEDPVQVRADHLVLGRGRRHALEPLDLAQRDRVRRARAAPLPRRACAAPAPRCRLRRAPSGSPSAAAAARTAAARRSSLSPRATRSGL